MAIRKQAPIYPDEARSNHISGTVLLMATIGRDGTIHDLSVVLSPSALLSQSAMQAVSHWVYKPYLLNGEPVEVDTTINVIYALGG
jgi:protein TonB